MSTLTFKGKKYEVDALGYLLNFRGWDEDFAEGTAPGVMIRDGLTKEHWDIIYFIRDTVEQLGRCPLVYQTYKMSGLPLKRIQELFPTGYLRGACKLAGVTYKEAYIGKAGVPGCKDDVAPGREEKTYRVDIRGFLIDSDSWDTQYAIFKASEMGMAEPLTDRHWKIIYYLRNSYEKNNEIPTVYQTCEDNNIDLEELEKLFPHGYHRGAVKIAGLRVR